LNREDRKAAIAAYRERKADVGIYVVRCAASGGLWVGSTPNLRTIWNRLSFSLRQGDARHATLQNAWREHGVGGLTFEIVERVDVEDLDYGGDRTLRDKQERWRRMLGAEPI
jgi:hypothetical protein